MDLRRIATEHGAILFHPARTDDAPGLFETRLWRERGALRELEAGRGSVLFLDAGDRHYVLRRCLRGGLPAKISRDRFFWLGEGRVRSFAELRLLTRLESAALPAPLPVAARYRRDGLLYRAEIVTLRLPACEPLSQRLLAGGVDARTWQNVGRTLRRFHEAGVQHADLNAANIMLGSAGEVWLLDFDRGRLRRPGAWTRGVLARLERSLAKTCRARPDIDWRDGFARLVAAHDAPPQR